MGPRQAKQHVFVLCGPTRELALQRWGGVSLNGHRYPYLRMHSDIPQQQAHSRRGMVRRQRQSFPPPLHPTPVPGSADDRRWVSDCGYAILQ